MQLLTGNDVRAIRKPLRLDATDLAAILGVHASTVWRWESRGPERAPVDAGSERVLVVLRRLTERAGGQHLGRLRRIVTDALSVGGGLRALWIILDEHYGPRGEDE